MKNTFFVIALLALVVSPAFTETITLQQGPAYSGTADTHIISWDGNQNQLVRKADGTNGGNGGTTATTGGNPQNAGGWDYIEEGDYGSTAPLYDDSKCILIKFDVTSVAAVSNAKIGLYYWFERSTGSSATEKSGTKKTAHVLNVNRILKPWARGNGGANGVGVDGTDTPDNTGAVTWNSTGYDLWQAMGAEGPEDIAPTESTTEFDPAVGGWVWFDVTESVKFWVANPGKNFGVKIGQEVYPDPSAFLAPDLTLPNGKKVYSKAPVAQPTGFVPGAHDFVSSSNAGKPELRPQLVVEGTSFTTSWELFQ
ncbi:MAG: hypothetical protein RBU29_10360 [bacterium]|jgi:hypothetical protein|nr:hypothetical protein [bacterium]